MNSEFVYLRSIIPAQSATTALPMSRTLSLYSINLKQFCDKFNLETQNFVKNLPLSIGIRINLIEKTFNVFILTVPIMFLIFFYSKNKKLTLFNFFKIIKIKEHFNANISLKILARNLYATCLSMGIKVI